MGSWIDYVGSGELSKGLWLFMSEMQEGVSVKGFEQTRSDLCFNSESFSLHC